MSSSEGSYSDDGSRITLDQIRKKIKNKKRLKELSVSMLADLEYPTAKKILCTLLLNQKNEEPENQLRTLLQIALCDLMTNRKIMDDTDAKIIQTLKDSSITCDELRGIKPEQSGVSVIQKLYVCKLYSEEKAPNSAVKNIKSLTILTTHEVAKMLEDPISRRQAHKLTPVMAGMVEQLKGVQNANEDLKVLALAEALNRVGFVLEDMGKYSDALIPLKDGRDYMTSHFGQLAPKHHIYATLANNIGATLVNQEDYEEAAYYHRKAIEEMKSAEDISDAERKKNLKNYEVGLKNDQIHMTRLKLSSRQLPTKDDTKGSNVVTVIHELVTSAENELQERQKLSPATNEKIATYLEINSISWDVIKNIALEQSGARAVLLNLYSCKMLHFTEKSETCLKEIASSFERSRDIIQATIESGGKKLARSLLPLFHEMLKELHDVSGAEEKSKARFHSACLNKLGSIYIQLSQFEDAVAHLMKGRGVMEKQFGSGATKHSVFASLANNIGYAYRKQEDYDMSAEYYQKAFVAIKDAEDMSPVSKSEKINMYKTLCERALSYKLRGDPKSDGVNLDSDSTLVMVGNGILVDQKKCLNENLQLYEGKFGGEVVAVKKTDFSDPRETVVKTLTELKPHPNIVQYIAWTVWRSAKVPGLKLIYLAMELHENTTLKKLAGDKCFTFSDRVSWLQQIISGLRHIHGINVIHGSLNPDALFLHCSSNVLKIGDFSMSKTLASGRTYVTLTSSKYNWIAPDRKLSTKSDVYSAGHVFYYILSHGKVLGTEHALDTLDCTDAGAARELIGRMIEPNVSKRPTSEECAKSDLFWDVKEKLQFVVTYYEHLSRMPPQALILKRLAMESRHVLGEEWGEKLQLLVGENFDWNAANAAVGTSAKSSDNAGQENGLLYIMHAIASCCGTAIENKPGLSFSNEIDTWNHFSSLFPGLFRALYELAEKLGFFLEKNEKLEIVCKIVEQPSFKKILHDKIITTLVAEDWVEKLSLSEAEMEAAQAKIIGEDNFYVVHKHSIYNMAVADSTETESGQQDNSAYGLLRFIANRKNNFEKDGKLVKWVFEDDTVGLWNFFAARYPNLLDDILHYLQSQTKGCNIILPSIKTTSR